MILIRFSDPEMELRALGYLGGRFRGKTWDTGETLIPDEALAHLAAEGFKFSVEGAVPTASDWCPEPHFFPSGS